MTEMVFIVIVCSWTATLLAGMRSAYRNGVCDGYGYAKEPRNPGYAKAGRYLRRLMYHRWPELLE